MDGTEEALALLSEIKALGLEGVGIVPRTEWMGDWYGVTDNSFVELQLKRKRTLRRWIRLRVQHAGREIDVHNPADFFEVPEFVRRTARSLVILFTTDKERERADQLAFRLGVYEARPVKRLVVISGSERQSVESPLEIDGAA